MNDTINGIIPFIILMAIVVIASRVLARFTRAKYSRALTPLAPIINGTFATDSLSHGWLAGTYGGRKIHVAAIPGVNEMSSVRGDTDSHRRYNAFDVEVQGVAGERGWSLTFGKHSIRQILSSHESWRFKADGDLLQRLQDSAIIAELETFAGAGVRGIATVHYDARRKTLAHRADVSPKIAPTPAQFQKQLDLALKLAQINENVNVT